MASLSQKQGWSFAVLLTVFPCVFFASTKNEAPAVTFRASTSEVRISFFATDQNNRRVEDLTQNDFAVVDGERVIRDFRSVLHSNETALDIVLVVDSSESVAPGLRTISEDSVYLASRHSAAPHTASQTTPDDRISVITFAGLKPAVLCEENCSNPQSQLKLASLKPAGPTPLFDTLAFTADFISAHRNPAIRQVLILFSDGSDTVSIHTSREAFDALNASGAIVYTVDMAPGDTPSNGRALLHEMAEATGGRYFPATDSASNVLETVLDDLHASYVVTYSLPSREAGLHLIRILPKHNLNLRFHCRRGYFYDKTK